jgi:hypothetical protein
MTLLNSKIATIGVRDKILIFFQRTITVAVELVQNKVQLAS